MVESNLVDMAAFFGLENGHLRPQIIIFFPLRGLIEGCALPGAEEIFIDLGGGAPKTPIFTQNRVKFAFSVSSPLVMAMLDGLRTIPGQP